MSDHLVLASRWRRLVATGIDAVLVPSLSVFLVMVFGVVEHAEDFSDNWWVLHVFLTAVLAYLLLNGYTLWRRGQTLGKMLLNIAMVPAGLETSQTRFTPPPLWKLIFIRALFFPLLFVGVIPYVAPLPLLDQLFIFGKKRRCLHDYAAGTAVIQVS